ncbi:hypothetical protein [Crenothrix sp.]|uniref:hypothetical protein n=1 Tax=Crenothrix sp. TaxID=3100433 RepID=UPI00374D8D61
MLKPTVLIATLVTILGFSVLGQTDEYSRLKRDSEGHLVNQLMGLFIVQRDKNSRRHAANGAAQKSLADLKQKLGGHWLIEWNKQGTAIKAMVRETQNRLKNEKPWPLSNPKGVTQAMKKDIAIDFLKANAGLFQLPTDLVSLSAAEVRDYGSGFTHYCCLVPFSQTYNGLSVTNKYVMVVVNEKNVIDGVFNHYQPNIDLPTTPILSKEDAINIIQNDALQKLQKTLNQNGKSFPIITEKQKKIFSEKSELTLIIHVNGKQQPVLAHEFYLHTSDDSVNIKYLIDANSGTIIEANDYSSPSREMAYLN